MTDGLAHAGTNNTAQFTRVLVVDDEPSARKLVCLMFPAPRFQCQTVGSAEEALVTLQNHQFDVVISDLRMPGLGGIGLLKEAHRIHPHAAFLVTTGVDDVNVGVQAMRSGADDYLIKPLNEEVVISSVERAIHKRHLERQLEEYRHRLEEMVADRTSKLEAAIQKIERNYQSTLEALGAAIDLRDQETAGHSQRVCAYSLQIARRMKFPGAQLETLRRGAYLHDIGKLGIPDSILLKPGPLTPAERKIMQQHVCIGFDLIKGIPFLSGAAEIVLTHHERFDGCGYPAGLRAEQIPLAGRIFAVVDALDAITSDRPYHRAASFDAAGETIRLGAGTQFDPEVVSVFLATPTETWPILAGNGMPAEVPLTH